MYCSYPFQQSFQNRWLKWHETVVQVLDCNKGCKLQNIISLQYVVHLYYYATPSDNSSFIMD